MKKFKSLSDGKQDKEYFKMKEWENILQILLVKVVKVELQQILL